MVEFIVPWVELHITTSAEDANKLGDQLILLGAEAITLKDGGDQPIYEPDPVLMPLWQKTIVIGLFDSAQAIDPIVNYLKEAKLLTNFTLHHIADENWERRCLEHFKPLCFGRRLWVCPSWEIPPDPNAINVILDPGLAFGTGTHATTALCLEWLDENFKTGDSVIDYGCGSGILAIAALKLGAQHVFAIDTDPQALQATRNNGACNHFAAPILETYFPDEIDITPANLLIANILAQPLIDLAPKLAALTQPQGKILLSGILAHQADSIIRAYQPWFSMNPPVYKQEWVQLAGIRQ